MRPLTPKQQETVEYIWDFSKENGYCPTITQVGQKFDIQDVSAYERIRALVKKKILVKIDKGKSRNYFLSYTFIKNHIKDKLERRIARNWICLSKKQWEVAVLIKEHYDEEKLIGPSVREISKKLDVSHATIFGHIKSLAEKEAITKATRQWRSYKLTKKMLAQIRYVETGGKSDQSKPKKKPEKPEEENTED